MLTQIVNKIKTLLNSRKRIAIFIVLVLLVCLGGGKVFGKKQQKQQYQTQKAEKGTLTIVVTASGQVSQANSATVDTEASGVVSEIYVNNGQAVKSGEKIAAIDLDMEGNQRAAQALASYQGAKNSLETAKINYYTLQSEMLTKWDTFKELAESDTYKDVNSANRNLPEFYIPQDDWLAAEAKYKNQENVVKQAQSSLTSAWLSFQQTSSVIYAPIPGTVTGLSLQIGSVLTAQSNSSGTSTAQKIASIQTGAAPVIRVDLTQIDTPKVKVGNQATLTFDAFPGKSFTGKVVSIDTIGSVSSGVTTYPAVIKLDIEEPEIYSNMTASTNIITQVKDNVLIVPSSAVQSQDGQSTVRVIKKGQMESVNVETGVASSTQVEIVSGLAEGDTVVTSVVTSGSTTQSKNNQTRSVFSSFGGGGPGP